MRKVIFHLKFNRILNINEIFNRFLRLIIKKLISKITHFFQIYFIIDYHFKEFKKVNIIIFRKFKKKNYSKFKAYKSIVFLNILNKVFKTMIIVQFNDYIKKKNLSLK